MNELWILILVAFFATNSLDKAEAVKVKLELKTFDEIFGEGWWDNDKDEEWNKLTLEHNFHHEIDKIEPNSTDQNPHRLGRIEPNSTDQNPPRTKSDHSGQIQLIRILLSPSLITLDKLTPIQLISLDKLNPIQLIRILLAQSLITLDKFN
uniref:Uncharacterized protein n=1 Tax=Globodera rostochiensis TaxID=31243 RepID=A0A914H2D4_GLORO